MSKTKIKIKEKNTNILDVEVNYYKNCDYCSKLEDTLYVPWEIYTQWLYLLRLYPDKEWAGILKIEDKVIKEFIVPKQEISSANVEFTDDVNGNGVIHSHHSMGAFHSGQDDEAVRNLYEYSIVIANNGYDACRRIKLPCGGWGYINIKLEIINAPEIPFDNIQEKKVVIPNYNYKKDFTPIYNYKKDEDLKNNKKIEEETDEDFNNDYELFFEKCKKCTAFNCKDCENGFMLDAYNYELPFCIDCKTFDCKNCWKLKKYLKNYPEDKEWVEQYYY
ncbi:MAG: hypothetical protein J7K20_02080 [Thermodesulfobacterium sp.]|nr:hypothetical protein [Thermodesulfobacterium sp.]